MKKYLALVPLLAAVLLPTTASAHQQAVFNIGGTEYRFVVGSLNEPIAVDDKTGVDLRVSLVGHEAMGANDHHAEGGAVAGLEKDIKVELLAGEAKKTLDLSPVYNTPGSYKAMFVPTLATTISYRFFGTLHGTPIDLTFTCRAEGEDAANEGEKEIAEGVTQVSKTGGFGCPQKKESLGFPEESASVVALTDAAGSASTKGSWALGLSVAALILGALAASRKRS